MPVVPYNDDLVRLTNDDGWTLGVLPRDVWEAMSPFEQQIAFELGSAFERALWGEKGK